VTCQVLSPSSVAVSSCSTSNPKAFVTSRVGIVGSNLLVTRPVTYSACFFALVSSSIVAFSSACYFSSAYSSSSWDFQQPSRNVVTWRLDTRSDCSSDSSWDLRLLSLFLFRVCYLSFLFRLCSLLLRLCPFLFFSFLLFSLPLDFPC
jgi:hypothetical protein